MYIRYVNKLHELHMVANNHAEAGLTLQLYARVLDWRDTMLPKEMRYKEERECDRKEMLYTQIINCFDKGKVLCLNVVLFLQSSFFVCVYHVK